MKILTATLAIFLLYAPTVLAHGGKDIGESTNLAEADWLGPIVAILIIVIAVVIANIIKKKSRVNK